MRRFVHILAPVVLAGGLALVGLGCSPDVPDERYDCNCRATNISVDNTRLYILCEPDGDAVGGDAKEQCKRDFGDDAECDCDCTRSGDC